MHKPLIAVLLIVCMTLMGCAAKPEQFTHSSATQKPIRVTHSSATQGKVLVGVGW
jgi:hypothetical protein